MCYSVMIEQDLAALELEFRATPGEQAFAALESDIKKGLRKGLSAQQRLYPKAYGAVVSSRGDNRWITPMRYGVFPPSFMHGKGPTPFNARFDSLSKPFWREAFGHFHGLVAVKAFYEWVGAKGLVEEGFVQKDELMEHFAEQVELRRRRHEAAGKPKEAFRLTKTEQKSWDDREVVVEFRFADRAFSYVPCLCLPSKEGDWGFAILTTDPSPFIEQVGHDRMPILLTKEKALSFIDLKSQPPGCYLDLLATTEKPKLLVELARGE